MEYPGKIFEHTLFFLEISKMSKFSSHKIYCLNKNAPDLSVKIFSLKKVMANQNLDVRPYTGKRGSALSRETRSGRFQDTFQI